VYKIASKVLANRLKQVLPEVVSEEQSNFVLGRLITDNVIMAYECLHFMKSKKRKKKGFLFFKARHEKSYDRVEWDYLEAIMKKLGFSHMFVDTIMRGVRSVTFLVLFNGARSQEFKPTCGICQGDPISLNLFLLAAEGDAHKYRGLLKSSMESIT
jgi:hypothetical protein